MAVPNTASTELALTATRILVNILGAFL